MLQKLMMLAAWSLLAFIAFATLAPIQNRPTLPASTSIEHIAAFVVVGALFYLAYPNRIAAVCAIVFSSAILLELMQFLTLDRHGRAWDVMEKLTGGAIGIFAGACFLWLANRFVVRRRWTQWS